MLKRFRVFIINQLGFSRKEANGTILLVGIILLVLIAPLLYKSFRKPPESMDDDGLDLIAWHAEISQSIREKPKTPKTTKPPPGPFNPNSQTKEKWEELGFSTSVANRIINFLNAGGRFYIPYDLYKIYGIDTGLVDRLIPFVTIPSSKRIARKNYNKTAPPPPYESRDEKPLPVVKKDLNQATLEELMEIRGIGEKLSQRIKKYGKSLGGYYSSKQLYEVYYLDDSLIPKIQQNFLIDTTRIKQLSLNKDSIKTLKSHPYLNYNQARAIVNYRAVHGSFSSIEAIKQVKIIPDSTYIKLIPYLSIKD